MASRDLTATFIERRTATNRRRRSEGVGSNVAPFGISSKRHGMDDDHFLMEEGQSTPLPPTWVSDVDSIQTTISTIRRLTTELSSMHASRIGTVFGRDLDSMEQEIEQKTTQITSLFRKAEMYLQKIGRSTKLAGGEEAQVGSNIQKSLACQLQELSSEFRQRQRKYLSDVKAQKSGGLMESETRFGINLEDDGTLQTEFSFSTLGSGGQQSLSVVDDLSSEIQSRDKEISQIAKSIEELGSIFKELAVLVIDQGTILDRIDYNMEAVVEHTKTGIQQLEKAERSQKSARPMKCIICLLCTIAVLLLILVLKHRS